MQTISRILCIIDPTADSQPGLARARWLAKATGANLDLVMCYYNEYLSGNRLFDSPSLGKARDEAIAELDRRLETLAEPLRADGLTVHSKAVWDHPLHEGIVRYACDSDASVVFKDTHHHSAVSRALFTNTDWNLIRTCPVPLWLVKPNAADADVADDHPVVLASIDPLNENDKPAALDDSILLLSKEIASATGGQVHAFHAYDPRSALATATANAYLPVSLPFDEIEQQMREQHGKRFGEVTDYHEIDAPRCHLLAGLTHEALPELAEELDADVVVMGAVARNRLKRLFIGATAERTLEHLPCDLLIVKPDWFETPVELKDAEPQDGASQSA